MLVGDLIRGPIRRHKQRRQIAALVNATLEEAGWEAITESTKAEGIKGSQQRYPEV